MTLGMPTVDHILCYQELGDTVPEKLNNCIIDIILLSILRFYFLCQLVPCSAILDWFSETLLFFE
jgi:hypothetical protein